MALAVLFIISALAVASSLVPSLLSMEFAVLVLIGVAFTAMVLKRRRATQTMQRTVTLVSRAAKIPFFSHSLPQVVPEELARARRYQRVLTLAILSPLINGGNGHKNGGRSPEPDLDGTAFFNYPLLGTIVRAALRESDTLTYDAANNRYLLLLPEVTREQAQRCLVRIQELVRERTTIEIQAGTAEYPTDALTVEDLIKKCEKTSGTRDDTVAAERHLPMGAHSVFSPMPAHTRFPDHNRKVI